MIGQLIAKDPGHLRAHRSLSIIALLAMVVLLTLAAVSTLPAIAILLGAGALLCLYLVIIGLRIASRLDRVLPFYQLLLAALMAWAALCAGVLLLILLGTVLVTELG